jgi:hypothetical protein
MTKLDKKIARLNELRPHHVKVKTLGVSIDLSDWIDGWKAPEQSKYADENDLKLSCEFELLEKEIDSEIQRSSTVVAKTQAAHQYIKERLRAIKVELDRIDEEPYGMDPVNDCGVFWNHAWPQDFTKTFTATSRLFLVYDIPSSVKQLVEEARLCAAWGQFNAVASLSRTIFETAVTDIAARAERIPAPVDTYDYYREYPPHKRLTALIGERSPQREQMDRFYAETSAVIHGSRQANLSNAMKLLEASLGFVSSLYGRYKASLDPQPKE